MGRKQRGPDEDDQRNEMSHSHGEPSRGWEPPKTTFRRWIDPSSVVALFAGRRVDDVHLIARFISWFLLWRHDFSASVAD